MKLKMSILKNYNKSSHCKTLNIIVNINMNQVIEGSMRFDGFCYALIQVLSRTRMQIVGICLLCTQGHWYLAWTTSKITQAYPGHTLLQLQNHKIPCSREPTRSIVVIWVKIVQTELMVEICFKSLVRAIGKVLLMKCR